MIAPAESTSAQSGDGEKTPSAGGKDPARRSRRPRFSRRFKWTVRLVVLTGVLAYVKFVSLDSFFYYPTRTVYCTPDAWHLSYEAASFKSSDGVRLTGWFLPASGAARGTVIHFHGNAENMTSHIAFVDWLPAAGFNLLVFDYRGYGQSEGKVTRAGTVRDGVAAIDYALSRPDVDPERLFVFGQSLGGAVAIVAAVQRPQVRAVAVDSTFSSYRKIAAAHLTRTLRSGWVAGGIGRFCISGGYDPVDVVARLAPRPLLVIASGRDRTCFPELSRELFDAAAEPKEYWLVAEADHTEALDLRPKEARERIVSFFERAVQRR